MAISAKFIADFDAFVASTKNAEASLKSLDASGAQVSATLSSMQSLARDLGTDFLAMFTARAAFNFVKDTVNEASALKDLGQQVHINVEELQILAGGLSEFGVDADTLGKGLYKLSRGIAGGDESVATGLHLMGMSLKDVEGLQGKELFLKIESGLATLQGGLRDTAAAELFGGRLGSALAGASEGIKDAIAKWQALNHVASVESVDAMDAFGESIVRAEKNLSSIAANMIGPVAQGFNVLNDAADKGASKWAIAGAVAKDFFFQNHGENLTRLLDEVNQKTEAAAALLKNAADGHKAIVAAIDTRTSAEKFMAALEADAALQLNAGQLKNLEHLKEIGALNAKNAAGIGVNASQFAAYTASLEAAKKATEELKAATKVYDDLLLQMDKTTFGLAQEHEKQWREERLATMERVNAALLLEFDAQTKLNAAWGLNAAGALQTQASAVDTLNQKLAALHANRVEGISQAKQEQVLIDAYTKQLYDEAVAEDRVNGAVRELPPALGQIPPALSASAAAFEQFKGIVVAGTGVIVSNLAQISDAGSYGQNRANILLAQQQRGQFFVNTNVNGPNAAVQTRDSGGPVVAGTSYLIGGGQAPELFTPGASGFVTPGGGGGVTVNATIYVNGTAADVARKVAAEILRTVKQGAQLS
jgi:hypothetical protein